MNDKKKLLAALEALLGSVSLHDRLEIIANLLISEGVTRLPGQVTPSSFEDLQKHILDYRLQHGETLEGALVFQGLMMLSWCQSMQQGALDNAARTTTNGDSPLEGDP